MVDLGSRFTRRRALTTLLLLLLLAPIPLLQWLPNWPTQVVSKQIHRWDGS